MLTNKYIPYNLVMNVNDKIITISDVTDFLKILIEKQI